MLPIEPFIVGVLGAFAAESLKLYQLYHDWTKERFSELIRSKIYPLIVLLMILASGLFASFFSLRTGNDAFMAFVHGAAAGPLLRTILRSVTPERPVTFGSDDSESSDGKPSISLRDIL
jgi:hypothetical protein